MAAAQTTDVQNKLTLTVANQPKAISPDLFGIFFEDINYSADGGLYAELIQNRSFEYQPTEQLSWTANSFWDVITYGGGKGHLAIDSGLPVHKNNPRYAVLNVDAAGDGVGLANAGFDGIAVKAGENYEFSFFARQLYMNERWGRGSSIDGKPMPISVRLVDKGGTTIAEALTQVIGRDWTRISGSLTPSQTENVAKFVLVCKARGGIALDEISLFPEKTFRNRKNGLRTDLAQAIADLKPKFIRFPGGCLAHGNGIGNIYHWKDTIGPIEQRKGQANLWGYHQSMGLGYFEYFQFCEDIGAKPLPVLAAGVSCQNSAHTPGVGQQCIPLEDMPAYIQDVLDLIEWANGPADSTWGAKRAAAGHPEPFKLQYLGVGNEDHITPGFEERFKMIFDAIKVEHPEITVVGTVGPSPAGEDFDKGWRIANELNIPIVDEHYYVSPDWFWDNLTRYDHYDRGKSRVYLGEYAAHDRDRRSTLRSALAEAAYMTSLERNGDVVTLSSYAPLLAKQGHTQWRPDLIYFDNLTVSPTINYFVQQLFASNAGDSWLPISLKDTAGKEPEGNKLSASCVRDTHSGDLIIKIVSRSEHPLQLALDLTVVASVTKSIVQTTLTGEPDAENQFGQPGRVGPIAKQLDPASLTALSLAPNSFTLLRIRTEGR